MANSSVFMGRFPPQSPQTAGLPWTEHRHADVVQFHEMLRQGLLPRLENEAKGSERGEGGVRGRCFVVCFLGQERREKLKELGI